MNGGMANQGVAVNVQATHMHDDPMRASRADEPDEPDEPG
jgi:hypothetical protein